MAIIKEWAIPMLREGLKQKSLPKIDAAVDLIIPPLSLIVIPCALLFAVGITLYCLHPDQGGKFVLIDWSAILIGIFLYVAVGLLLTRAPIWVWLRLTAVPLFIAWKILLYVKLAVKGEANPSSWVRTKRHGMQ